MKEKSIKIQKVESLLKEIVPEALSTLEDSRINGVSITDVDCSKGKYDADIYFHIPFINEQEKSELIKQLKAVSPKIAQYTLASTGWYRSPKFHFKFDNNIDKVQRMEELFKRIKSE